MHDSELASWQWPNFGRLMPLDLGLVCLIVGLVSAAALRDVEPVEFRAKLSEALLAAAATRLEIVERLALSGDPLDVPGGATVVLPAPASPLTGEHGARRSESRSVLQDVLSGGGRLGAGASAAEGDVRRAESRYITARRIEGNAAIVAGRIGDRPFELALYAAALDIDVPQVLVWQCGPNRLGPAWQGATPMLANQLPDRLLPAVCRHGGPR